MEKINDRLELALSLTIDWLKFAESKNALLITANGAAIFGLFTLLRSDFDTNIVYTIYIYQSIAFLAFSSVFTSISFIPYTGTSNVDMKEQPMETDNLLVYTDIAKYNPKSYLKTVYAQGKVENNESTPLERDLAELIVTYSRISVRKYSLFNKGIWCTLSAIVTPIITVVIFLFKKKI